MKCIAIISHNNEEKVGTLVMELTKGLLHYGKVYLFLMEKTHIIEYDGVSVVDIGISPDYYEYNIDYYKRKFKIDVAISVGNMMNTANVRTKQGEGVLLLDNAVRGNESLKEVIRREHYYSYADAVIDVRTKSYEEIVRDCIRFADKYSGRSNYESKNIFDKEVFDGADAIYIYGAGLLGKAFFLRNKELRARIRGFIVTKKSAADNVLFGVPILELSDISDLDEDSITIIAVCEKYINEVLGSLYDKGQKKVVFPYYNKPFCYEYYRNEKDLLDKRTELMELYSYYTGKTMNIDAPRTYNEKLQWMKLHDRCEKSKYADKLSVRSYIKEKIGEEYLVPYLGVWDKYEEIDFGALPDKFVLKCTHASGYNVVVTDKENIDHEKNRVLFERWMSMEYQHVAYEDEYEGITPRIIAEKMLEDDAGELKDYKVFVFDGKARLIQVDIDRFTDHRRNLYTPDWEYVPCSILYPTAPEVTVKKPNELKKLIEVAEKISAGFTHIRADFYICNEKIYFGEMTFHHGGGYEPFEPEAFGDEMGDWMVLPKGEER